MPEVADDAWVAPGAVLVGRVRLGSGSSVWYGAVLRGDGDAITVGAGSNVQDGTVVHADPGFPAVIGDGVVVGPRRGGARLHRRGRLAHRHGVAGAQRRAHRRRVARGGRRRRARGHAGPAGLARRGRAREGAASAHRRRGGRDPRRRRAVRRTGAPARPLERPTRRRARPCRSPSSPATCSARCSTRAPARPPRSRRSPGCRCRPTSCTTAGTPRTRACSATAPPGCPSPSCRAGRSRRRTPSWASSARPTTTSGCCSGRSGSGRCGPTSSRR